MCQYLASNKQDEGEVGACVSKNMARSKSLLLLGINDDNASSTEEKHSISESKTTAYSEK